MTNIKNVKLIIWIFFVPIVVPLLVLPGWTFTLDYITVFERNPQFSEHLEVLLDKQKRETSKRGKLCQIVTPTVMPDGQVILPEGFIPRRDIKSPVQDPQKIKVQKLPELPLELILKPSFSNHYACGKVAGLPRFLSFKELFLARKFLNFPVPESMFQGLQRDVRYTELVSSPEYKKLEKSHPPFNRRKKLTSISCRSLLLAIFRVTNSVPEYIKNLCFSSSLCVSICRSLSTGFKTFIHHSKDPPHFRKTNLIFPSIWPRAPNFF